MNKTKFKYVKYTKLELDRYVSDEKSCIKRVNSELHVGFPPWGFANFEETLTNIISRDKIGKYDAKLDGIILEVRNIKVLGTVYPVHDDDPYNHINIRANFYVFQPQIGSIIKGVVKHISHGHVAVIIYRVFNVSIRFDRSERQDALYINQKISFRIKKFELQGAMPYIAGELVNINENTKNSNKHLKFENDDENDVNNGGDSGISTEETLGITGKKACSEAVTSSSDSDSNLGENSNEELAHELISNIRIKQEKLSDSEENLKLTTLSGLENIKRERSEFSDESDSESDETESNDRSGDTSSSDSELEKCNAQSLKEIKKEKDIKGVNTSATFIPRPIKNEPQSDTEGTTKFKKPAFNTSIPTKSHKKNKYQTDDDDATLVPPFMPATLKIKQEPPSEDESGKRKKRKLAESNKSFESIENDLFNSFLK